MPDRLELLEISLETMRGLGLPCEVGVHSIGDFVALPLTEDGQALPFKLTPSRMDCSGAVHGGDGASINLQSATRDDMYKKAIEGDGSKLSIAFGGTVDLTFQR